MKKIKVLKEAVVSSIAKETKTSASTVRRVLDAFEEVTFQYIANADKDYVIEVRPFEGWVITGNYTVGKEKVNNLTGEVHKIPDKIKPKVSFTRVYIDKLTSMIKQ